MVRSRSGSELIRVSFAAQTTPRIGKIATHSASRACLAATRVGTLGKGDVAVMAGDVVMAGPHAREAVMAGSLDDTNGGSKKKERSGQLHSGELVAWDVGSGEIEMVVVKAKEGGRATRRGTTTSRRLETSQISRRNCAKPQCGAHASASRLSTANRDVRPEPSCH